MRGFKGPIARLENAESGGGERKQPRPQMGLSETLSTSVNSSKGLQSANHGKVNDSRAHPKKGKGKGVAGEARISFPFIELYRWLQVALT